MSRFFRGDSDSDSSSESSDDSVDMRQQSAAVNDAKFMMSSSESEEEKRVVRSAKDKRYDEIRSQIQVAKNKLKINDWAGVNTEFDGLLKVLAKAKNVTQKEGIPRFFFKAVLEIQDSQLAMKKNKPAQKKLNKANSQGLNKLGQKLRKWNEEFARELVAYNANPLLDDADDETLMKKKKKSVAKEEEPDDEGDDEGDEDSEDWDSDNWDTDGDDDTDDEDFDLASGSGSQFTRAFWVKKVDKVESKEDKEEKRQRRQQALEKRAAEKKALKEKAAAEASSQKDKKEEFTADMVIKKLKELQGLRGKRGTNKQKMVEDLKELSQHAHKVNSAAVMHVKCFLVVAYFDCSLNRGLFLPIELWKNIYGVLLDIVKMLRVTPTVRLAEDDVIAESFEDEFAEENAMSLDSVGKMMNKKDAKTEQQLKEEEEARAQAEAEGKVVFVKGNLFSFVQRLFAEYRKSLQNIESHSTKYVERLKDEPLLLALLEEVRVYYEEIGKASFQSEVALMRLELLYYVYHPEDDVMKSEAAKWAAEQEEKEAKEETTGAKNTGYGGVADQLQADSGKVAQLAAYMYKNGTERQRMRALLCHVYNLAVHNKYQQARDLMLMSHAQDTINEADIKTRILYNRVMAQLGLCAFRCGEVRHALYALGDLYGSNRIKELIAQGVQARSWYREKDPKKEKLEKLRQFPYHMHMNLDMLEAVHLISAMFVEAPDLVTPGSSKRRQVTKSFRRLYDYHCKQAFNGPPDNTRDLIMASVKALLKGHWEKCVGFLSKLRMWSLMPNSAYVLHQLREKIKEEALRMHLLRYAAQYTSISLESLCSMFQMQSRDVHRITSKMMVNEQLRGAWDQVTGCIVMHEQPDQTPLQLAAVAYAEKISQFLEQNERLVDHRSNWYKNNNNNNKSGGWKDNNKGGWKGRNNRYNRY